MTTSWHRLWVGGFAFLLAVFLAPVVAAPAQAATTDCRYDTTAPRLTGITPSAIAIGRKPVTVDLRALAEDACGIAYWTVRHEQGYYQFSRTSTDGPEVLDVPRSNLPAGWSDLIVGAADNSANRNWTSVQFPLRLLRQTTFEDSTFNVRQPGGALAIDAKLLRMNWATRSYEFMPRARVVLQHRAVGATSWQHMGTFTADEHARAYTSYQAPTGDPNAYLGAWRLRYLGNETSSTTTSPEVTVTRVVAGGFASQITAPGHSPSGALTAADLPDAGMTASPAAQSAVDCTTDTTGPQLGSFTPTEVTVGLSPTTARFAATASDPCGVQGWSLAYNNLSYGFTAQATQPEVRVGVPAWNVVAGWSDIVFSATDNSTRHNASRQLRQFRMLRKTQWQEGSLSLTAPVNMQPVTMRARLLRVNWDYRRYSSHIYQRVALERRPVGSATWQHVGFYTTNIDGWVNATYFSRTGQPADYSGSWRLRYYGGESYGAAASPESQV